MSRPHEEERLRRRETSAVVMPDAWPLDLPYIPILWAAFDPVLFFENRERLLGLRNLFRLTTHQQQSLDSLSNQDINMVLAERFFHGFSQWTDVVDNLITGLGIADNPDLATVLNQKDFITVLRHQLQKARGNLVLMGRQHSIQYPVHAALSEEMHSPDNMKVAEIVFDKHIDTIVNPDLPLEVTSANVYSCLVASGLLTAPVIVGPSRELVSSFKARGEDKNVLKLIVLDFKDTSAVQKRDLAASVLGSLQRWGVTNVVFTVDLDVLSVSEGAYAVRYSPLLKYIRLGCQELPVNIAPDDLVVLERLQYPTAKVRYFLQHDQIARGQVLNLVRQSTDAVLKGLPMFSTQEMELNVGVGLGLSINEVDAIIRVFKKELQRFGIRDGIQLKNGGRYRGSVVEMCGYEDREQKTSKAAISLSRSIAS